MNLVWLSILIVAVATIPRIQSVPLEALESALEETLEMKAELELEENLEADNLEKRRPKPHPRPIDAMVLITELQRYFLNSSNSTGNNSVWTIKQFEEKGFNLTHLLFKLNNSTLMNIVAEYFVKNGLDKYVIRDTSANSSMNINVPLILEDLSVIKAVDILIKSRVVPGPRRIRHHQGGGSHERGESGSNGGKNKNGNKEDCNDKNNDKTRGGKGGKNGGRSDSREKGDNNNRGGKGGKNGGRSDSREKGDNNNRGGKGGKNGGRGDNNCDCDSKKRVRQFNTDLFEIVPFEEGFEEGNGYMDENSERGVQSESELLESDGYYQEIFNLLNKKKKKTTKSSKSKN